MDRTPVTLEKLARAYCAAVEDQRQQALRALRGDPRDESRPRQGPLLLGMGQAAKLLGVSRTTLWRLTKTDRLKTVEILPGSFRVRREDVERLVDGD